MVVRTGVMVAAFLSAVPPGPGLAADTRVPVSDVIGGDVPDGTVVELEGHLFATDGALGLSPAQPSARPQLPVTPVGLSAGALARIAASCHSTGGPRGGCAAVLRGEIRVIGGSPLLAATAIEIAPPPER